jgi:hypothetical protein
MRLQDEGEFSDPEEEFAPGGYIPGVDGDFILAWISPAESFYTAADLRAMWESSSPEWNEGEVP